MSTQQAFTKDNIIVTDVVYDASASGDGVIEAVNEYLIENNIKAKYMEEVSEAASQTF